MQDREKDNMFLNYVFVTFDSQTLNRDKKIYTQKVQMKVHVSIPSPVAIKERA